MAGRRKATHSWCAGCCETLHRTHRHDLGKEGCPAVAAQREALGLAVLETSTVRPQVSTWPMIVQCAANQSKGAPPARCIWCGRSAWFTAAPCLPAC
jgi:hypothetical protein